MMIYDDGLGQGEGDDNIGQVDHDECVSVCHEKSSLPTSELSAGGAE